ncbi:hypothetical protein [Lactobacillus hominis]|uniref:HTH cro/C1-type domain-containing protein n=1 Tax=Lactobacillus hominis DSM 23910 = CRBIP 24.179 TaxID=1423758 RepID=I7L6Z7_9LACO|nr:hypothetical protein [Lactobacillus hominis]KRM84228.1 hypothetical protein FC41_GL001195 [Lactobacillus hominis DSM 23910 = CRBIP 24.179]MCT3348203.1 XRE family transcriptional regulator [Lactobacillus hominis]CCI82332.1 Putative uncharacterized protein [Lactobacillus hominis DSM 23910 = CRBIP 24.179]
MEINPYNEIKAWMVLNNVKQKDFAKSLGISTNFLNRKLNRRNTDFTLSEARKLTQDYGFPMRYFFENKVPLKERKEKA